MLNLLLTVLCSTSIAIILKVNSNIKGNPLLLLTGNYFSASVISLFLYYTESDTSASINLIPFGIILSFFFVGAFLIFAKSVVFSGAAISTVSSRLSVFVPIVLSILFFNEIPNTFQLLGLLLTLLTILLFYFSISNSVNINTSRNQFFYLVGVLFLIGIADFFMNVFQENWDAADKPWFLFWIFFSSFIITFIITIRKKIVIHKKIVLLGILMGIPNMFSSYFLIESLKNFSAVTVYPIVNIGIIVLTSIIVKIFWKEKWSIMTKFAIIVGILSIGLLSL